MITNNNAAREALRTELAALVFDTDTMGMSEHWDRIRTDGVRVINMTAYNPAHTARLATTAREVAAAELATPGHRYRDPAALAAAAERVAEIATEWDRLAA